MSRQSSPGLVVTACSISHVYDDDRVRALVSVELWDCLCINGIKIIEASGRHFVAMPTDRRSDGWSRDIVHPVNQKAREELETVILRFYEEGRGAGPEGSGVPAPLFPGPPTFRFYEEWPSEPG